MTEEEPEDERDEELSSISAIFPELCIDPLDRHSACLELPVAPCTPLQVAFSPAGHISHTLSEVDLKQQEGIHRGRPNEATEHCHHTECQSFTRLPSLHLRISLPDGYPETVAPRFKLHTYPDWLPKRDIDRLQDAGTHLWEECGRSQTVFAYVDFLQHEAESAFGLLTSKSPKLVLPETLKGTLQNFDEKAQRDLFEQGTFDCGVCLEPKKGVSCYRLQHCGHVFCIQCLQDFYTSAITEGDVASVKCLALACGKKDSENGVERKSGGPQTLHPRELLQMSIERAQVRRYIDLKLKKMHESDNDTVYCPRKWCQAPARSPRYARYYNTQDLENFPSDDEDEDPQMDAPGDEDPEADKTKPDPDVTPTHPSKPPSQRKDRLSICSKCAYAFCNVCHRSWHGDFLVCRPPSHTLTEEERATMDYIRLHTSPCPTCSSPVQKTMGCNHMICFQCRTHFCYLCGAWLPPGNPYGHFNGLGGKGACYMRLWELEEGEGDEDPDNAAVLAQDGENLAEQMEQMALNAFDAQFAV